MSEYARHISVLGLPFDSSLKEIKDKYRVLAKLVLGDCVSSLRK